MDKHVMIEALRKSIQNAGIAIMNDKNKLKAFLSDFLPGFTYKSERMALLLALEIDEWKLLLEVHDKGQEEHERVKKVLLAQFEDVFGWTEERSILILECYTTAMGWNDVILPKSDMSIKMQFQKGQQINTVDCRTLTIDKWLGSSGQGDVYEVDFDGHPMALKWYKYRVAKYHEAFWRNIKWMSRTGAPSSAFQWPEVITEYIDGSFGYVMKLRPDSYEDFPEFLIGKVHFKDGQTAIRASLIIVNSFKLLHNLGLSYQDINDGNFYINPDTGDVLICDNENVAEYGATFGIVGKPGYVAPEIIMGEKTPSVHTDRFSLAVILFLLFVGDHPFMGQMTIVPHLEAMYDRKLFEEDPVFIFHPTDHRNSPIRGIHGNALNFWRTMPKYIQDAFIQTFVEAVKDRGNGEDTDRTSETTWEKLLLRLRDETITCPKCGWDTVYPTDGSPAKCMNAKCGHTLPRLLILDLMKYKIVLYPGMKIYGNHLGTADNFDIVIGEVVQNKKNPSLWGIKNLTDKIWQVTTQDGNMKSIIEERVVPVFTGIKVSFGRGITAEII
jgi:serine/threonine protein kinase